MYVLGIICIHLEPVPLVHAVFRAHHFNDQSLYKMRVLLYRHAELKHSWLMRKKRKRWQLANYNPVVELLVCHWNWISTLGKKVLYMHFIPRKHSIQKIIYTLELQLALTSEMFHIIHARPKWITKSKMVFIKVYYDVYNSSFTISSLL